ncbi:MAG: hypothetical protein AAB401_14750 [Acidobacteriota bacterium]
MNHRILDRRELSQLGGLVGQTFLSSAFDRLIKYENPENGNIFRVKLGLHGKKIIG